MNNTANHLAAVRRPLLVLTGVIALFVLLLVIAQPGAAQEPVLPSAPPDSATGLELFETRCANCHGETGAGDGDLIGNLPAPPRPFDANYRRNSMPSQMYNQITNGNLQVGMPPFGPASQNAIPEQNRWDLVGAVYSLATPPNIIESGQQVYEANCASCHGADGKGGPDAANTDLTAIDYWFNRSNDTVFQAIQPGAIAAHDYTLSEGELLNVVDYSRTFSYSYFDPARLNEPLPVASITGQVTNTTTGEIVGDGTVLLRAFTPDFNETLTISTTVGADGNYRFDLTDIPPNWVFIASTNYNDLSFSSDASQLSRSDPQLALPIQVFEQTTDPSVVNVGQLHVVFEFAGDRVRVNELYVINNNSDTVFMGEDGVPEDGVVEVAIPEGAENLSFQRSFGGVDSFLPANDFVQTARGWADPQALGPGAGALTLLARYELPYESGMTISHPIFYDTATSTIILPDAGVEVTNMPWVAQQPQDFGQGQTFLNYLGPGVPPGETISMKLEGRPQLVTDETGAVVANRDQTTELIIGGTALLLVAGAGIFYWQSTKKRRAVEDEDEYEVETAVAAAPDDADALLREIAGLDAAYEAGQLDEAVYHRRRAELKQRLAAVWGK